MSFLYQITSRPLSPAIGGLRSQGIPASNPATASALEMGTATFVTLTYLNVSLSTGRVTDAHLSGHSLILYDNFKYHLLILISLKNH